MGDRLLPAVVWLVVAAVLGWGCGECKASDPPLVSSHDAPLLSNPRLGRWSRVDQAHGQHAPFGRYGHTAVVFRSKMVVFGGVIVNDGGEDAHSSGILSFDMQLKLWSVVDVAPNTDVPEARAHHGACVVADAMYVFGGETANGTRLNDMWRFNFTSSRWNLLNSHRPVEEESGHGSSAVPAFPSPRSKMAFSACPANAPVEYASQPIGCLMMYGGEDEHGINGQMWQYSLASMQWHFHNIRSPIVPPPRLGSTMSAGSGHFQSGGRWNQLERAKQGLPPQNAGGSVVVFGGSGLGDVSLNDMWSFHVNTSEWQQVYVQGGVQCPGRDMHAMGLYDDRLFVWGGIRAAEDSTDPGELGVSMVSPVVWQFAFSTHQWQQIHVTNAVHPMPRFAHSLVQFGGSLWLYGGVSHNRAFRELWEFTLGPNCPHACVHGQCDFATRACICADMSRWAGPSCNATALPGSVPQLPSHATSEEDAAGTGAGGAPGTNPTGQAGGSQGQSIVHDVPFELDACSGRCAPRGVCDTNTLECMCLPEYRGDTCDTPRTGHWVSLRTTMDVRADAAAVAHADESPSIAQPSQHAAALGHVAHVQKGGDAVPRYDLRYGPMPSGFYGRYRSAVTNVTDPSLNANFHALGAEEGSGGPGDEGTEAGHHGGQHGGGDGNGPWGQTATGGSAERPPLPLGWYAHTGVVVPSESGHAKMVVFGGALITDDSDAGHAQAVKDAAKFKRTGLLRKATNRVFEVELQLELHHPPAPISTQFQPNPAFLSSFTERLPSTVRPPPRYQHTAFAHDGAMWVFGGLDPSGATPTPLADMWRYVVGARRWEKVEQWVRDPSHEINQRQMEAARLGLSESDRRALQQTAPPPPPTVEGKVGARHGHSMCVVQYLHTKVPSSVPDGRPHPLLEQSALMFGGMNWKGEVLRDMWEFNLATLAWMHVQPHPHQLPDDHPTFNAEVPVARAHHSCAVLNNPYTGSHVMMIAGGMDESKSSLADAWLYDVDTNTWTRVAPLPFSVVREGAPHRDSGAGRRDHFAMASVHNAVYVFGGVSSDGNLDNVGFDNVLVDNQLWRWTNITNRWTRILSQGSLVPSSRVGHSVTVAHSAVVLFGGVGYANAKSDLWAFVAAGESACGGGCTVDGQCNEEQSRCECDPWVSSSCSLPTPITPTPLPLALTAGHPVTDWTSSDAERHEEALDTVSIAGTMRAESADVPRPETTELDAEARAEAAEDAASNVDSETGEQLPSEDKADSKQVESGSEDTIVHEPAAQGDALQDVRVEGADVEPRDGASVVAVGWAVVAVVAAGMARTV